MGQADSPLTVTGLDQAKHTAKELDDIQFDAVYSSDLGRAYKTAEIIRSKRKLDIQTSIALRERTYGSWEGRPGEDFKNEFQHLFDRIKELPEEGQKKFKFADDIENDEQVISRFTEELREIAALQRGKTVLVVTHGGCIRTFLMNIGYVKYGELPVGSFSNAGYAKIAWDGVDFNVIEVSGIKKQGSSE